MSQSVLKVTNETIDKMKNFYSSSLVSKYPQGSIFVAKVNDCTITAYKSGKVLFQGKAAELEAQRWESQKQTEKKNSSKTLAHKYSPPKNINKLSIIGSDEVGTGDYFGPITVVAAFVSKDMLTQLTSLGVKDSKHLSDEQIMNIAKKIMPLIPYSLLILHNEKYNELQQKGMTQGKMKALLHNQAINHVLNKVDDLNTVDGVLIDQFVQPDTYYKHIYGKKQKWKGPTYFSTKAEGVHLSVAAASIIARYAFVKEFSKLEQKIGIKLHKGAGSQVDQIAAKILRTKGEDALRTVAKLHFANTKKAKKLM